MSAAVTCPCTYCGKESTNQCSGCKDFFYCGTKCQVRFVLFFAYVTTSHPEPSQQKNHWKEIHKYECGKPRDCTLARRYNKLGVYYGEMNNINKALDYHEKAIFIEEKALGRDHPDLASSYNNLALVCKIKKDYDLAMFYYKKALVIFESVFGKNDPATATAYNNLGTLYKAKQEYGTAVQYCQKAADIWEKSKGSNDIIIAGCYGNLGGAYYFNNKKDLAIKYYRKSLRLYEVLLGKDHSQTIEMKFLFTMAQR